MLSIRKRWSELHARWKNPQTLPNARRDHGRLPTSPPKKIFRVNYEGHSLMRCGFSKALYTLTGLFADKWPLPQRERVRGWFVVRDARSGQPEQAAIPKTRRAWNICSGRVQIWLSWLLVIVGGRWVDYRLSTPTGIIQSKKLQTHTQHKDIDSIQTNVGTVYRRCLLWCWLRDRLFLLGVCYRPGHIRSPGQKSRHAIVVVRRGPSLRSAMAK